MLRWIVLPWFKKTCKCNSDPQFCSKSRKTEIYQSALKDQERLNQKESECSMQDGEQNVWNCNQFKKLGAKERNEAVKRLNLCFCCLNGGHRANKCKLKEAAEKMTVLESVRLLHRDGNDQANSQLTESGTNTVLTATACSGILQVLSVKLSICVNWVDTLAVFVILDPLHLS